MSKKIKLSLINWNEEYEKDMANGIGFDITNPVGINKDKKRTIDGIYSPLFGTELSEEIEYIERYSCDCKNLTGKFYEGIICENCNKPVIFKNNDIKKTGWITLNDYYLINPLLYEELIKVIGLKNLTNIIKYNKEIDKDGNLVINASNMDEYDPSNPFYNIGIIEFHKRFDEIIEYYKIKLKPDKIKYYDFLIENRDKIFVNHFPVFSLLLRPILIIKDNMIYADINKKFSLFVTNIVSINKNRTKIDKKMIKILPNLYQTQIILNEIRNMIISMIGGKRGHIRNNMLGMRINFSSRCVIVPLIGKYKSNQVKIPYLAFLEMFKFEIINQLCKMDNITRNQANEKWNKASQKFDRRIYLLMKHIIKNTEGGVKLLVNRNPTLSYGSTLEMEIIDIKDDYNDLTMDIPINVLKGLEADFDGDVLNIISLKDQRIKNAFDETFDPRHMMIDKNNGKFNRNMNLIKDQLIGLYAFCNDD